MSKIIEEDDFNEQQFFRPPPKSPATSRNPLASHFRLPGCHVQLPTRGAFFEEEAFEPTLAGDVPVFPMKASDELLLKSPDALMSGYALEKLIESCVPSIRDPRKVTTPDLDVILLAIRASTYGDTMEIEVECPSCRHANAFEVNLPSIMSTVTFIDPENPVTLKDDLVVYVRPYTLDIATRAALITFEEVRKLQAIENDEERQKATNESFEKMSKLNLDGMADSIVRVISGDLEVTDREYIKEFVHNTSQGWIRKIERKLTEINSKGVDKHVDATCTKCSHEWSPEVEFDPSSFFDQGS